MTKRTTSSRLKLTVLRWAWNKEEEKQPSLPKLVQVSKKSKKFKIIIDPSILYDDHMHAGMDISTILKSISAQESDKYLEEEMEQDNFQSEVQRDYISQSDHEMNEEDQDSTIIKIPNLPFEQKSDSSSKFIIKIGDEIIEMDPDYARILDEIVRAEFMLLESECEDKDNKKDAKRK